VSPQRERGRKTIEQRGVVGRVLGTFAIDMEKPGDLAPDQHRSDRDRPQLVAHHAACLAQDAILDGVLDRDRPPPPRRQLEHRARDRYGRVVRAPDQRPRERLRAVPQQDESALRRQRLLHRRQHGARC